MALMLREGLEVRLLSWGKWVTLELKVAKVEPWGELLTILPTVPGCHMLLETVPMELPIISHTACYDP